MRQDPRGWGGVEVSATNRGGSRVNDDFYATESWVVDRFLEAWPDFKWLAQHGAWLEPGAGDGAIIKAVNATAQRRGLRAPDWAAVEIDSSRVDALTSIPGVASIVTGDFLKVGPNPERPPFAVSIGNPPFSLAMEFVQHCRKLAHYTALLLRLDFLGSAKRSVFMREDAPNVYVLPNRPSFGQSVRCRNKKGCGWSVFLPLTAATPFNCNGCAGPVDVSTTDSCDYAWFVWGPGQHRNGTLTVLDETTADVRKVRP